MSSDVHANVHTTPTHPLSPVLVGSAGRLQDLRWPDTQSAGCDMHTVAQPQPVTATQVCGTMRLNRNPPAGGPGWILGLLLCLQTLCKAETGACMRLPGGIATAELMCERKLQAVIALVYVIRPSFPVSIVVPGVLD